MTPPDPTRLDDRSDEELVSAIRGGDVGLYEVLIRRHNRRLYRAIRSIVRSEADIEELMQSAYVSAFEHLDQYEGRASFATWLTRIAIHASYAHARRSAREAPIGIDADGLNSTCQCEEEPSAMGKPEPRTDPESAATGRELRAAIEASIDSLPEHYRCVFVLRTLEEMSVTETAESLGIEEQTVKTRFFRARALLQRALLDRVGHATRDAFEFHLSRCDRVVAGVLARLRAKKPSV